MAEVIVALDLPDADAAWRLLDRAAGVRWVKVGSILFTREGPAFVRALTGRGYQVFLDLKWHDIPNTVAGAVLQARDLGVSMATVHALGGPAMLAAAREAAGDALLVVAVTVLTSHSPAEFAAVVGRGTPDLGGEALRLAAQARQAGLPGIVCSAHEVAAVRGAWPEARALVVPGIRRPGDAAGDQARTATPAKAVQAGATHLVVGRPVLQAADPAAAWADLARDAGRAP